MKKTIDYHDAYVSCVTCDVCYDQNGQPTRCQMKGCSVDPRAALLNMNIAANCTAWFPKLVGRQNCGKDYDSGDRWYEKDSIA